MSSGNVPVVSFSGNQDKLIERVQALATSSRGILGICGPPGAGKSTLAAWLAGTFTRENARLVSMDGFHLSNAALQAQGLAGRKGAIETFDADGYAALLGRLRHPADAVVYAPEYDRAHGEPIAATVSVGRDVPLIITEGNYLLADAPGWTHARQQMDEVWFVDVDPDLRRQRLIARHVKYGKSPSAAKAWVHAVDEANATLIADCRQRADLVVHLVDDLELSGTGG